MATMNPFDLLVDDDAEDPNQLVAASKVEKPKKAAPAPASAPAKLPTKPLAPAQAVRDAKNEGGRGGGRGRGRGKGQGRGGGRGYDQNFSSNENNFSNGFSRSYNKPLEEGDGGKPTERNFVPRGGYRGGRRGGFDNGNAAEGERPRRVYERRSGTGHGNELKRDGSGRGNWGTPTDEVPQEGEERVDEVEKNVNLEKTVGEEGAADANKEKPVDEAKAKEEEEEEKQMTLEEYEKVLAEKRKALLADKAAEERKVDAKVFDSMQQLSNKKNNDDIFIKLGSEKDKRKDAADKEDKAKKVTINEFLKPAEGQRYHNPGGRGRGRGRGGPRDDYGNANVAYGPKAPAIADLGQFPSLGGK